MSKLRTKKFYNFDPWPAVIDALTCKAMVSITYHKSFISHAPEFLFTNLLMTIIWVGCLTTRVMRALCIIFLQLWQLKL